MNIEPVKLPLRCGPPERIGVWAAIYAADGQRVGTATRTHAPGGWKARVGGLSATRIRREPAMRALEARLIETNPQLGLDI